MHKMFRITSLFSNIRTWTAFNSMFIFSSFFLNILQFGLFAIKCTGVWVCMCVCCFIKLSNSIEYQWNTDDFRCNVDHFYTEIFLFIEWLCCPINDLPHRKRICLYVCVCVNAPKHRYAPNNETFVFVFVFFAASPLSQSFVHCCNYYIVVTTLATTAATTTTTTTIFCCCSSSEKCLHR